MSGGRDVAGEDLDGDGNVDPNRNANDALFFTHSAPGSVADRASDARSSRRHGRRADDGTGRPGDRTLPLRPADRGADRAADRLSCPLRDEPTLGAVTQPRRRGRRPAPAPTRSYPPRPRRSTRSTKAISATRMVTPVTARPRPGRLDDAQVADGHVREPDAGPLASRSKRARAARRSRRKGSAGRPRSCSRFTISASAG